MKITALTENTSKTGLPAEHGLSLYIETDKFNLLFDSGQSALFSENAMKLGIDLSSVDYAILSHGHYDHGGGLLRFIDINHKAPVFLSKYAFDKCCNGTEKYIGLSPLLKDSDRLIFTDGTFRIAEGLTLYSAQEINTVIDLGSFGLNVEREGKLIPDDFRHEQYLLIEEKGKRVLISGCSHRGIINIEEQFDPDYLIGGFHFSKLPTDEKLRSYAEMLDSHGTVYYTCHCTGVEQYEFMKNCMSNLNYISAGDTVVI